MVAEPKPWWRAVPIDAVAFVAIASVVIVSRLPFIHHGLAFNDSSWFFHYGRRALAGDVPYRDYVFQVGPLPIYVDAGFQAVFGSKLVASLYAAAALHIVRVFAVWAVARRLAGWKPAALLSTFCATDLLFGWAHHWSWAYAQLFITASGLCFVLASRATSQRRAIAYLGLAGFSAGLVVASRQSTVVMLGAILLVTTLSLALRGQLDRRRLAAIWIGFASAFLLVFGALAMVGALGPAIQQMFLDAPQKKGTTNVRAVLDALSGGGLVTRGTGPWQGFVKYLLFPIVMVSAVSYLLSRTRDVKVPTATVGLLLVPGVIAFGLFAKYASLEVNDLPRMFFTGVTTLVVFSPDRFQRWFGVEPLLGIGLTCLPLASDWAVEMSLPGRGWTDAASLAVAAVLLVLASRRVSGKAKTTLCGVFAVCGLLHTWAYLRADLHPFAMNGTIGGTLSETRFTSPEPIFDDLQISESRQKTIAWLRSMVPPGSTCFLYGTNTVLYDVLECTNPTRIDTTIPDFITLGDAEQALVALRARPPDFLISQETSFLNVPLTADDPHWDIWAELNQRAGVAMHQGLRDLLEHYEVVGLVGDAIGPDLAKQATAQWDNLQSIRLYRRKR